VNREMEGYYLYNVIPPLIEFVDDLTNWFIRRSRRRFWGRSAGIDASDTLSAFATLYEVLTTFSKLMAPVLPFVTEAMYQGLVVAQRDGADGVASVHHEDYPEVDESLIDTGIEASMAVVRSVVSLGRGLRVANQLKIRTPLQTLTVVSHDDTVRAAVDSHAELIAEELNVKVVTTSDDEQAHAYLAVKPNYRSLGPRMGPRMKKMAAAVEALGDEVVATLIEGGEIEVIGETLTLDDVVVGRTPREGIVVTSDEMLSVALDTVVTPDLAREGLSREIVKLVQAARRSAGLGVSDRITLTWDSDSDTIAAAMEEHGDHVAAEVLAVVVQRGPGGTPVALEGETISLKVEAAAQPRQA